MKKKPLSICVVCNIEYNPEAMGTYENFCSDECAHSAADERIFPICKLCEREFDPNDTNAINGYCSSQCFNSDHDLNFAEEHK